MSPRRHHDEAALGAGLADSCAACHGRPRGSAGAGGDVATRPDSRDAPHLFGLGSWRCSRTRYRGPARDPRASSRDAGTARCNDGATSPERARCRSRGPGEQGHPLRRASRRSRDGRVDTPACAASTPICACGRSSPRRDASIREFSSAPSTPRWGCRRRTRSTARRPLRRSRKRVTSPRAFRYDPRARHVRAPAGVKRRRGPRRRRHHERDRPASSTTRVLPAELLQAREYRRRRRAARALQLMERSAAPVVTCRISRSRTIGAWPTSKRSTTRARHLQPPVRRPRRAVRAARLTATAYPQLLPPADRSSCKNIFTDFKRHDLGPGFHERNYDGSRSRVH